MHRTYRYKSRASARLPLAVKGLALIFSLCVVIRVFSALGVESASNNYLSGLVSDGGIVDRILNFELGSAGRTQNSVTLASLILDSSILGHDTPDADAAAATTPDFQASAETGDAHATGYVDPSLYYNSWFLPEATPESTQDTPNIITKPVDSTISDYIAVNNQTDYTIDTAALLKEPLNITLSGDSPVVLIIHTHSSEAYTRDGVDQYVASDPYRTEDKSQNIVRVGDELAAELTKRGIPFVHDREVYDYPSYNGSYTRSYEAIQAYLKQYPSIKMVIDMHRDAIEDTSKNVYRTIATVGDTTCSQVLLVMGTNFSGLQHPNWRENLKLALHLQNEMNQLYPSLAKPIKLSQYRYNQQATTGSMIVEVGCTGNTLQESLAAVRYFADAFSNVVESLYK